MKIPFGVSYHLFDNKIYIHNVTAQKDYTFIQDLYNAIAEEYDIPDKSELEDDLREKLFDPCRI